MTKTKAKAKVKTTKKATKKAPTLTFIERKKAWEKERNKMVLLLARALGQFAMASCPGGPFERDGIRELKRAVALWEIG
jgi:hypothetical protein